MAYNYSIETEQSFRSVPELVAATVDATKPVITSACVGVLKGPRSLWPVATGLSKRSWKSRRRGPQGGQRAFAAIINTANRRRPSGTRTYAQFVNDGIGWNGGNVKHKRAVQRTIRKEGAAIAREVDAVMALRGIEAVA